MPALDEATTVADVPDLDRPPSLRGTGEVSARTTMRGSAWLISVPLILIAVAAAVGGVALIRSHPIDWLAPAAFLTSAFFLISSAVVPLVIVKEGRFEQAEKENCQNDCEDLYWALNRIGDRTLQGLAWVNFKQLRVFTVIAQKQARMSYYASLVAAAISLLVLIAGAAVAIGSPATSAKVAAGTLATVGTVMSGFLVKTFLRAYQMASRQMSYYYGQPLVHCYLLHAEWLSSGGPKDLSDAVRARLWEKVVDASIKAASDAQGHLVSMQMPDRRGRGKARGAQSPDRLGSHRSGPKPYAGRPFAHDNHEQA